LTTDSIFLAFSKAWKRDDHKYKSIAKQHFSFHVCDHYRLLIFDTLVSSQLSELPAADTSSLRVSSPLAEGFLLGKAVGVPVYSGHSPDESTTTLQLASCLKTERINGKKGIKINEGDSNMDTLTFGLEGADLDVIGPFSALIEQQGSRSTNATEQRQHKP
jgi:hypothetical protein